MFYFMCSVFRLCKKRRALHMFDQPLHQPPQRAPRCAPMPAPGMVGARQCKRSSLSGRGFDTARHTCSRTRPCAQRPSNASARRQGGRHGCRRRRPTHRGRRGRAAPPAAKRSAVPRRKGKLRAGSLAAAPAARRVRLAARGREGRLAPTPPASWDIIVLPQGGAHYTLTSTLFIIHTCTHYTHHTHTCDASPLAPTRMAVPASPQPAVSYVALGVCRFQAVHAGCSAYVLPRRARRWRSGSTTVA